MLIQLDLSDGDSLDTAAASVLQELAGAQLYHSRLGMRNPFGAFNVALQSVWESLSRCVEELERVVLTRPFARDGDPIWFEELLRRHESLLYSLMEYIETCHSILTGCFPTQDLAKKHSVTRDYERAVKEYRNYVAKIVNAIKHSQARLRSIVAFSDRVSIVGYYVESALPDGVIGPNEAIHRDGDEAFSIGLELRYHLFGIYSTASALATALKQLPIPKAPAGSLASSANQLIVNLVERVAALDALGFPSELDKCQARLTHAGDGTTSTYALEYPFRPLRVSFPTQLQVSIGTFGDAVSSVFRFPMIGERRVRDP